MRVIDAIARAAEREERLRTAHCGNLGLTLVDAAQAGGLGDARFLIAAGADVDGEYPCHPYNYSICAAAEGGHVGVLAALLDAGSLYAEFALHQAAKHGHVPAVALLLARGAPVHG